MADFIAVLKKTIDGLGENTPEIRQKVYAKARATIAAKLEAVNPPLSAAAIARQKQALEEAITTVEREYAPAPDFASLGDELESAIASLEAAARRPAPEPRPLPQRTSPSARTTPPETTSRQFPQAPAAPAPQPAAPRPAAPASGSAPPSLLTRGAQTGAAGTIPADRSSMPRAEPLTLPDEDEQEPIGDEAAFQADDDRFPPEEVDRTDQEPRARRSYRGLIAAAVALLVIIGAGYGIYAYQDQIRTALSGAGSSGPTIASRGEPSTAPTAAPPPETEAPGKIASAEPEPEPAAPPAEPQKFTQRLNPDGTETDAGPAGGEPGVGEGTAVASATTPPKTAGQQRATAGEQAAGAAPAEPPAADGAAPTGSPPAGQAPSGTETATTQQPAAPPALAIGQKAIFYEEQTVSQKQSAESGAIVWSLVQESPGGDLPPEPAIRGEAEIPGKGLKLRLTIRRNADKTLPASHIVEMIFLTPPNFAGGSIDNVLRITMKETEQAAGTPLIGIPARIADGYFLMALSDAPADIAANAALLKDRTWMDIPILYKSGRRALITMEKGLPGEKVFNDALKAWQSASSG